MVEKISQIDPMSGFIISEGAKLTDYDKEIINSLYQPILGPQATILLITFWNLLTTQPMVSNRMSHSELMNIVNMSPKVILESRNRLEALNLLQTWHNIDSLGEYYVYELHTPLVPQKFFVDDLMTVLLLNAVGPNYYKTLQDRFKLRQLKNIKGENISKKIMDVFTINPETFKNVDKLKVDNVQRNINAKIDLKDVFENSSATFDFELLVDLLASVGIKREYLEEKRNLFYTLHQTFGIDELALSQIIKKTISFDTKELNDEQLKLNVIRFYGNSNSKNIIQDTKDNMDQTNDAEVSKTVNSAGKNIKMTPELKQLLNVTKELSPEEFLKNIKDQKDGFISNNEIKTILDVVELNLLPIEVINTLTFYILIYLNQANISRSFFNNIANNLSQNHVKDSLSAITFLANYKRKEKSKNTSKNYAKQEKKVETKPIYKQPTTRPMQDSDVQSLKEKMEQLKSSRLNQSDN